MTGPFSVFYGSDESDEGQGEDEERDRKGGMSQWHFLEQVAVIAELELRTTLSYQVFKASIIT
jgi:hypothetical protein